jgi:peptidoglycan/LPS O-acetylase OafA/YrhL
LISGILLDSRQSGGYFSAFYARRTLRIFPLYYIVLLVTFVLLPLLGSQPAAVAQSSANQVWLWTYLVNWTEPHHGGVAGFPHFWSLAVEEQFYLVWPLLVRFAPAPRLLSLSLGIAGLSLGSRLLMVQLGADSEAIYHYTICRMDALVLGAALAAAFRLPALRAFLVVRARSLLLVGLGLLALLFVVSKGLPRSTVLMLTVGYSWLAVGFGLPIAAVVSEHLNGGGVVSRVLSNAGLRSFGKYSYALYVVHQPLNLLLGKPWLEAHGYGNPSLGVGLAYMAVLVAASYVVAFLSFHLIERHFLQLKRHFVARPSG